MGATIVKMQANKFSLLKMLKTRVILLMTLETLVILMIQLRTMQLTLRLDKMTGQDLVTMLPRLKTRYKRISLKSIPIVQRKMMHQTSK